MIQSDVSRGGAVVWYHDCSRKLECGTMNNLQREGAKAREPGPMTDQTHTLLGLFLRNCRMTGSAGVGGTEAARLK